MRHSDILLKPNNSRHKNFQLMPVGRADTITHLTERYVMKTVSIGHLTIDSDDLDLLECLAESTGLNGKMYIPNESLVKALKSMGYANVCYVDWICGTDRLRTVLPKIREALEAP